MKKLITLVLVVVAAYAQAQFANQVVFKRSFTQHQVDSILQTQGIPSGVFPINYPVRAYKIIYNTVDWDSVPTTASGLLVVPQGAPCKLPVLSYQHGTTIKKSDAPSRFGSEWFVALAAASKGIIAIMPDYLGLGDGPGLHPYQHAHTEATAVIDMIRASKEVLDTVGASADDQLFLFGYSQGGHATMAAHELIQEQLDSVMHVTASAPMSGAYDMSGTMADVMLSDSMYPEPYYLPYLFFGYNEVYNLFTNDSDIMVAPYDTTLRPLFDGNHNGGQINNIMPSVPKLIMQPFQIDSFKNDSTNFFREKLRENDTYNWKPNSPVRMYFCRGDQSVSYLNSIVAYQHFLANGSTMVDTVDVSGTLDHYPCAQFAILAGSTWFDSLAYKPVSDMVTTVPQQEGIMNGSATATGQLGEGPYSYSWNTGDSTATINDLAGGTYYVTITDKNLCTKTDSAVVSVTSGINDIALMNVRVFPNPTKNVIHVQVNDVNERLAGITVYNAEGQIAKTYTVTQGNDNEVLFDNPVPGVYYVEVKAINGKSLRKKIILLQQ